MVVRDQDHTPDMVKLTEVILTSSKEVNHAVKDLRNFKKRNEILNHCIEINRLENTGDDITHVAVRPFSRSTMPLTS